MYEAWATGVDEAAGTGEPDVIKKVADADKLLKTQEQHKLQKKMQRIHEATMVKLQEKNDRSVCEIPS